MKRAHVRAFAYCDSNLSASDVSLQKTVDKFECLHVQTVEHRIKSKQNRHAYHGQMLTKIINYQKQFEELLGHEQERQ